MGVASKVLKWTGISALGLFTLFAILFTAGESLSDPGGWKGALLVVLWLGPLLALSWLVRSRPDVGSRVATGLVAGVLAIDLWAAIGSGPWHAWEHRHGPWRAIITMVLGGVLAVLATERPRRAGSLLTLLGGVTMVLSLAVRGSAPLAVIGVPVLLCGLAILGSTLGADHHQPSRSNVPRAS